jgi:hypothetical protein
MIFLLKESAADAVLSMDWLFVEPELEGVP